LDAIIDRIVIDRNTIYSGLGSHLYSKLLNERGNVPLTCEISINPPNIPSIRFHEKFGFLGVGTFYSGGKVNRMYLLR